MKELTSPLPCSVAFETDSGVIPDATAHYQKRLSDLRGLFLDPEALERRIREENDPICYENYAVSHSEAEGDFFFGTLHNGHKHCVLRRQKHHPGRLRVKPMVGRRQVFWRR